jgi:hypothetical protein
MVRLRVKNLSLESLFLCTAIPYRESTGVYRENPVMKTDPCNENRGSL